MKKIKICTFALLSIILSFILVSCKMTVDARIAAYEKSVTTLEKKYKDLTPSELESALKVCERQYDGLTSGNIELTPNQKSRISNIHGRYHKLLLKIELYTITNELFDGENVVQYLRGLLPDLH